MIHNFMSQERRHNMNNGDSRNNLSMEPLINLIWEDEIVENTESIEPFMITARCSCGSSSGTCCSVVGIHC